MEALHFRQAVLTVIGRKRTPDNAWNFVGIFYYKVPLRRHGVWQVRTTLIIDCSNECAGKHLLSKVKRAVDAYNSGSFREYETRAPNRSSFQLLGIAKWLLCLKILLHGCGLIHTALPQNFCEVSVRTLYEWTVIALLVLIITSRKVLGVLPRIGDQHLVFRKASDILKPTTRLGRLQSISFYRWLNYRALIRLTSHIEWSYPNRLLGSRQEYTGNALLRGRVTVEQGCFMW